MADAVIFRVESEGTDTILVRNRSDIFPVLQDLYGYSPDDSWGTHYDGSIVLEVNGIVFTAHGHKEIYGEVR